MFKTAKAAIESIQIQKKRTSHKASNIKMKEVLANFNHPENSLPVIHITGTNGKGSTANFLRNILQCAGYNVGLFSSPHLLKYNERIQVNGHSISDENLLRLANKTLPFWQRYDLGMFEITTLIAVLYFREVSLDFVVFEVGIGGRFDSTNFFHPLLSLITNVDFDHMNVLGNTIEDIAWQKAGIIVDNVPVITMEQDEVALRVFRQEALKRGSCIIEGEIPTDIEVKDGNQYFEVSGNTYSISTIAPYQVKNATLAILASFMLQDKGQSIPLESIKKGLLASNWKGRFQEILPQVYLDGAHNLAGIRELISSMRLLQQPVSIVFAVLGDKEGDEMLKLLSSFTTDITVTTFSMDRALPLSAFTKSGMKLEPDYQVAVKRGIEKISQTKGSLVITGSLYFISEVYAFLISKDIPE